MTQIATMLGRCRRLEERAAAVYRSFAAASRGDPSSCALFTALAREEEEHVRGLAAASGRVDVHAVHPADFDGWEETLTDVEDRLTAAEHLGAAATTSERLAAVLDLEMTELEATRRIALEAAGITPGAQVDHGERLAHAAETLTDDPHVRLQIALLRARLPRR